MPEKDVDPDVARLYREKDELREDIRWLNEEKIRRLEEANMELERKADWLDKERIKVIKERDNFRKQVKNFRGRKWSSTLKMICVLVVIDLIIVPILVTLLGIPIQWIFISMGVVTFFGILIIANYMSGSSPFNTGEVRKAIIGSFVTVYFALIPLLAFNGLRLPADQSTSTVIISFTVIVGVIVVFYFLTRAIEEYVKTKNQ